MSACGSGNFLYIALQQLKDLEREAIIWGSTTLRTPMEFPRVGPEAVKGIEINPYAAEIARVVIWIGEIQWMLNNGFAYRKNPILSKLDAIENRDALLDWTDKEHPVEAEWPDATFIVGNPPFIGGKLMRTYLTDAYVDHLFGTFNKRVPREADFVTYWHEKARALIEAGRVEKVGLLATQGIRAGANRRVLERIKETGEIYTAWSDEPWILDGAAVHVSFVAYTTRTSPRAELRHAEELKVDVLALERYDRVREGLVVGLGEAEDAVELDDLVDITARKERYGDLVCHGLLVRCF